MLVVCSLSAQHKKNVNRPKVGLVLGGGGAKGATEVGVLKVIEAVTVGIFIVEYILRLWTADFLYPQYGRVKAALRFLISFDGVVDLLTILPFFFLSGFVGFRILRVVRIFRLFRVNASYDSFNVIAHVIWKKKNQIFSSVFIILMLMLVSSLCMYSAEHEAQPQVFKNAFSDSIFSNPFKRDVIYLFFYFSRGELVYVKVIIYFLNNCFIRFLIPDFFGNRI